MRGRAYAWANLAYRFGLQMLRLPLRPFGLTRGAAAFLGDVVPEGYVPLEAAERGAYPGFMRCVSCGLCALACPELCEAPASAWDEAWTFVAGGARSIDRAPVVAADLGSCARCDACAAACPTGVPIPLLAEAVRRLARHGALDSDRTDRASSIS